MYKLVGSDNREYGPVSREAVLEWIAQGRANARTIARFEEGAWRPLATFEEFHSALGVTPPPPGTSAVLAPPISNWSEAPPPAFSGVGSQTKTNIPAVLGLILSIVCCCCPFVGLVLSIIGYVQIRSHPNTYSTSQAIPIAGIVVSVIFIILDIMARMMDSRLQTFLHQLIPNLPQ